MSGGVWNVDGAAPSKDILEAAVRESGSGEAGGRQCEVEGSPGARWD
jgi:hypothetical protein